MVARCTVLALVVACSGNKARVGDDAVHATPRGDAAVPDAPPPPSGDLQVRVEWKAVPAVMRNSPGRTPCNTPRAASLAPTTTWGIPDVIVLVEGVTALPGEVRVVVGDCALRPRLAAGLSLVVESAAPIPTKLTIARHGVLGQLDSLRAEDPRTIQLPISGHAVTIPLDAGGVYQLAVEGKDPETAWIVAAPAAITEANGQAVIRGVAVGKHAVTAWLPARGGQLARVATGTVTVVANELAELTIDLEPSP